VAIQHGQAIFNLQTSFQVLESGPEHRDQMPDVPDPESLPQLFRPGIETSQPGVRGAPDPWPGVRPFDLRFVQPPHWMSEPRDPNQDVWVRSSGSVSDDPLVHAALVAYASDIMLLGTATLPHHGGNGLASESTTHMMASLDHAMWFHRPCRADEWLLYHCHSPVAGEARGFARGEVFRQDGTLCVSIAQEGLVRPKR
jgi:acyl-CoA thioesterase-2